MVLFVRVGHLRAGRRVGRVVMRTVLLQGPSFPPKAGPTHVRFRLASRKRAEKTYRGYRVNGVTFTYV